MLPLLASSNISNIANKRGSKSSNLAIIIGTWRKEGDHNKENNSSISYSYSAKRAKEMEVSTDDIPSLRGWFLKVR